MSLTGSKKFIGTESQTLKFVTTAPTVGIIPAPPPPAGPKGIPTPFPVMTTTASIVKKPASKVEHKGKKITHTDSVFDGIKGDEAAVGDMPPGQPKHDMLTRCQLKNAKGMMGCDNVKQGGKCVIVFGNSGMGNLK